mmetsp:Transcript_15877/g.34239  ORF Transcript_15877/g.34239 Transcript_15877/m.34239 type:complete len:84 (-) Transcript_15877:5693-5944(-)
MVSTASFDLPDPLGGEMCVLMYLSSESGLMSESVSFTKAGTMRRSVTAPIGQIDRLNAGERLSDEQGDVSLEVFRHGCGDPFD